MTRAQPRQHHGLQAAVVYLNTLMVQDVLDEGLVELGEDDSRGLTPLFWSNIGAYGEVRLNMRNRTGRRPATVTVTSTFRPVAPATYEGQPR